MKIIIIPDIHFGLQPAYTSMDYPLHILNVLYNIQINNTDAHFIFTGDIFHNAGIKSFYSVEEMELLYSLLNKERLSIVRGNGKHCHDIYKHSRTFEETYSKDAEVVKIGNSSIALIGYSATQGELDKKIDDMDLAGVDAIVTHNFLSGGFGGAVFPNIPGIPIFAGHDHTFMKDTKAQRYCVGSLVNTDFGSASDKYYAVLEKGEEIKFEKIDCVPFETWQIDETTNFDQIKKSKAITRCVIQPGNPALFREMSEVFDVVKLSEKSKEMKNKEYKVSDVLDFKSEWKDFAKEEKEEVIKLGEEAIDAVE